jgi:hypothetical protein
MELHNHLVRPEQHNALRIADYPQSFSEYAHALTLNLPQVVVDACRPAHMPAVHPPAPGVMS